MNSITAKIVFLLCMTLHLPSVTAQTAKTFSHSFTNPQDIARWTAEIYATPNRFAHAHDAKRQALKLTPIWSPQSSQPLYSYSIISHQAFDPTGASLELDIEIDQHYLDDPLFELSLVLQMNQPPWTFNAKSYRAADLQAGRNRLLISRISPEDFIYQGRNGLLCLNQRLGITFAATSMTDAPPLYLHEVKMDYSSDSHLSVFQAIACNIKHFAR